MIVSCREHRPGRRVGGVLVALGQWLRGDRRATATAAPTPQALLVQGKVDFDERRLVATAEPLDGRFACI
jgi:hypothetical protein